MEPSHAVILKVLAGVKGPTPSTKLVKLVYLVDYAYFQYYGRTLTGFQYQWDHFGPDALGHAIVSEARKLTATNLVKMTCEPNIYDTMTARFEAPYGADIPSLSPEAEMVIQDVLAQYGHLSVSKITAESKRTAPFKNALQYSLLHMEQSVPAKETTHEDREAYERDLKEAGMLSLEEVKGRYHLD